MHIYEVRPRKDTRGVDLISDALPFGGLWYGEPDAISTFSRLRKVLQPARIASLSSLISWAMSSRLASCTFAWQRTFVISAWDQPLFGLTPQIADPHGVDRARGQL